MAQQLAAYRKRNEELEESLFRSLVSSRTAPAPSTNSPGTPEVESLRRFKEQAQLELSSARDAVRSRLPDVVEFWAHQGPPSGRGEARAFEAPPAATCTPDSVRAALN